MRSKRSMAAFSLDPRLNLPVSKQSHYPHGEVVEEIEGLIRVQRDGQVERPPIIPTVLCTFALQPTTVLAKDIAIDKATNLWARIYLSTASPGKLPLLIYFHGGGFCVGSAAWSCYHEFLLNLASKANCVIISVNYRLAPENRLPAAYEDGFNTLLWVKHQDLSMSNNEHQWWLSRCNMSSLFLAGDSAGANIAYHIAARVGSNIESKGLNPLSLKGTILVQPFFGGESRTGSEKHANNQPTNSALTISASDTYWRLTLPSGANRDHPWCNPLANGGVAKLRDLKLPAILLCVSEMDILKDRNIEFSNALVSMGKKVEITVYKGVGHAFQVLQTSHLSRSRTQELISRINAFLNI